MSLQLCFSLNQPLLLLSSIHLFDVVISISECLSTTNVGKVHLSLSRWMKRESARERWKSFNNFTAVKSDLFHSGNWLHTKSHEKLPQIFLCSRTHNWWLFSFVPLLSSSLSSLPHCNSIQCSFIEITPRESESRIGIKKLFLLWYYYQF
jgi:hypothetical protein